MLKERINTKTERELVKGGVKDRQKGGGRRGRKEVSHIRVKFQTVKRKESSERLKMSERNGGAERDLERETGCGKRT